jgi:metallo-beta-lactamase class B
MKLLYLIIIILSAFSVSLPQNQGEKIIVTEDIELIKLTENVYVHVSYYELEPYGRFPSNGMIYINDQEAYLFDTPMTEELTMKLVSFIHDSLKIKINGFVPNHSHDDCTAGMKYLNDIGVISRANVMTTNILNEKNLPLPQISFQDSQIIDFGGVKIVCKYMGSGHTSDNIVVWLLSENVLFGGCMVKGINSKGLGNIADADLEQWPETIKKVMNEFPDAKYVIPGHGKVGGTELLTHTFELLTNKK